MTPEQVAAMFSSAREDWATPRHVFDALDAEFGFRLDAASFDENALVDDHFTPHENALWRSWAPGPVFLNPPYGRRIGEWIEKSWREAGQGVTVVLLLPARTDTRWFHDYCMAGEIRFIKGRLKFGGATVSAPFPSMVVVFRGAEAAAA